MRQRNYKIILIVTLGLLLSFSAASAKNFSIFNAITPSQSYFTVNGTSGNVGIGMTNPTSLLQLLNNGWISAQNAAGTGVVNMFKVNANDQIEVGAPLNIGSFEFSPDSGLVSFVDMPVTSAATAGTPEGYAFKVDGDNIMTAYSESNGTGGIQNKRLGIGLTNPTVALDVSGALRNTLATTHSLLGGAGNVLVMSDNSGNLYATSTAGFLGGGSDLWGGTTGGKIWNANYGYNIGMGTTNPFRKLDINQAVDGTQLQVRNNGASTLSQSAGIQFSIGDSGVTTDEYAKGALFFKGDGSDWGRGDFVFALDNAADAGNASTSDAKMVIRKDGNVGIGTTTPGAKLDVYASSGQVFNVSGSLDSNGILFNVFDRDAPNRGLVVTDHNGNTNVGIGTTTPSAKLTVHSSDNDGSSVFKIYDQGDNMDVFTVENLNGSSPGVIIKQTGNVGIGITNPTTKLYVSGTSLNTLATTHSLLGGAGNVLVMADNTGALYATSTSGFSGGTNFWGGTKNADIWNGDAGAGNVGIGTTAPGGKLTVAQNMSDYGSAFTGSHIKLLASNMVDNTGLVGITYAASTSNNYGWSAGALRSTNGLSDFVWKLHNNSATGTEILRITSTGYVGIGTTTPSHKLDISSGDVGAQLKISNTSTGYAPASILLSGHQSSARGQGIFHYNTESDTSWFSGVPYNVAGANWMVGYQSATAWDGAVAQASTSLLMIKSNGNIGIGNTNPVYKLDVAGNVHATGTILAESSITSNGGGITFHQDGSYANLTGASYTDTSWAGTRIAFNRSRGTRSAQTAVINGDVIGWFDYYAHDGTTNVRAGQFGLEAGGAVSTGIVPGQFYVRTANSAGSNIERMTWYANDNVSMGNNGGNLGIGTPSPTTKLYVAGTALNTLATTHSLLGGAGNVLVMADNTGALYATSTAGFGGSGSSLWGGTLNGAIWNGDAGAGNVGIGTTNPLVKNHIFDTVDGVFTGLVIDNRKTYGVGTGVNEQSRLIFSLSETAYPDPLTHVMGYVAAGVNSETDSSHGWMSFGSRTSGSETEKMRLTSTGNVGIGTTNPNKRLHVVDDVWTDTSFQVLDRNSDFWLIQGGSGATEYSYGVRFQGTVDKLDLANSYGDVNLIAGTAGTLDSSYLTVRSGGNVGIGVTNPQAPLSFPPVGGQKIILFDSGNLRHGLGLDMRTSWETNLFSATDGTNGHISFGFVSNTDGTTYTERAILTTAGNLGIGTTNPTAKLYVAGSSLNTLATTHSLLGGGGEVLVMADDSGNLYATSTAGFIGGSGSYLPLTGGSLSGNLNMGGNNILNINKLTVNTIDPLYNIQGTNYSTFAASIAGGVKEEYIGRVKINKLSADGEREYVVDFDNLAIGSDLWVWRKTVDFSVDNVEVIATPYGSFAQVYYKIEDNKIIFRADRPTTISYRLSGRRVDWRKWPTKALDQTEKAGFVIE